MKIKVIKEIQSKFKNQYLIIRSSSIQEDGWETAQAEFLKAFKMLIQTTNKR